MHSMSQSFSADLDCNLFGSSGGWAGASLFRCQFFEKGGLWMVAI